MWHMDSAAILRVRKWVGNPGGQFSGGYNMQENDRLL